MFVQPKIDYFPWRIIFKRNFWIYDAERMKKIDPMKHFVWQKNDDIFIIATSDMPLYKWGVT